MLRTLRRSTFAPTLRRLLAVLLGLCVSVAFAEPVLADSCDGDAPATAIGLHAGEIAARAGDVTPQPAALGASGEETSQSKGAPEHAVHLCHCAHTHGSTLTPRVAVPDRLVIVSVAPTAHGDRLPPSVTGEPQLRPPLALTAA